MRRGVLPENAGTPLATPLFPSVMYHYESVSQMEDLYEGRIEGFTYARYGNPNSVILAEKLSWMEGAAGGTMTASGMTAITAAMLGVLSQGDGVAASSQLYRRSLKLVGEVLPRLGFEVRQFDPSEPASLAKAITPGTRVVLTEVISNPMLRVANFAAIAEAAKAVGALLLVDNTFTTPSLFNPLANGADLVAHSVTKMLSGHSDLNLGYIGGLDPVILDQIADTISIMGFNASPHDCWLAERGLHTFDLRLRQAQANAASLADLLVAHEAVTRVHYPGLADHVDHDLARSMLPNGYGTMVGFVLGGDRSNVDAFLAAAGNIPYGSTLGDVATVLTLPAISSHRTMPRDERLALGIEQNLVRVSVGIEDFDLIAADFAEALDAAKAAG